VILKRRHISVAALLGVVIVLRLVILLATDGGGVYVLSRSAEGKWTRARLLVSKFSGLDGISIEATRNGEFIVRAGSEDTKEWLLRPGG